MFELDTETLEIRKLVDVEIRGCGIGAIVFAYEKGRARDPQALILCEAIQTSYGYCSGQAPVAHIGLGSREERDIVVRQPHGRGETLRRDVRAGTRLRLESSGCVR